MVIKTLAKNKKAFHDYFIEDTYEAGIVLEGTEVKSCRQGKISFKDSYCDFRKGELYLIGTHISPYSFASGNNHDPERERKLLLNKRELNKLIGKIREKGFSLIPLSIYLKNKYLKVEIALARGKKSYDKREAQKQKEADRHIHASIKKSLFE